MNLFQWWRFFRSHGNGPIRSLAKAWAVRHGRPAQVQPSARRPEVPIEREVDRARRVWLP